MKKYYCKDCKKEVSDYRHKRCRHCSSLNRWKHIRKPDKFCNFCGKKLSRKDSKICLSCRKSDKTKIEVNCSYCNKKLLRIPYWTKLNKKFFCNTTCYSLWKSIHFMGEDNPNHKEGRTLKEIFCKDCGKKINFDSIRCTVCSKQGENSPRWIDGRSFEEYPSGFNGELKEQIRKRDNYECQNCGITEEEYLIVYGRVLEIHHIDYSKINCTTNNLITLCKQCNLRANINRDYWIDYYKNKIGVIIDNQIKAYK